MRSIDIDPEVETARSNAHVAGTSRSALRSTSLHSDSMPPLASTKTSLHM